MEVAGSGSLWEIREKIRAELGFTGGERRGFWGVIAERSIWEEDGRWFETLSGRKKMSTCRYKAKTSGVHYPSRNGAV